MEAKRSLENWMDDVAGAVCVLCMCIRVLLFVVEGQAPQFGCDRRCPVSTLSVHKTPPYTPCSLWLSTALSLPLPPLSHPLSSSLPQSQGVTKTVLVSYSDL